MNKKFGVKYIHLCDYFSLSQGGKVNIVGIFDSVFTNSDQAILGRAFLVSKLVGTPNSLLDFSLRLKGPKGNDLFTQEFKFPTNDNGYVDFSFELVNFLFPEFGIYKFQILDSSKGLAGEFELNVTKVKQPVPAQA